MWRLSALILALIVASCAGTSEKEQTAEEELAAQNEREEALREMQKEFETERADVKVQLDALRGKIGQARQELAEEKALIEKYKAERESIQAQLGALGKEQKETNAALEGKKQESASEEEIAKFFRDAEFVVHGSIVTFGTSGMDGSLVKIKFHVREVLKGDYKETEVEFEELPPGKVNAVDLFKNHGNDYIICFKKGATEGKYEYCGPYLTWPEIVANEVNLKKVKETYLKTSTQGSQK